MDIQDLITLCISTNNPENMNKYLLKTIHNLVGLKDFCTVAINFQEPYTENDIKNIVEYIESLGFKVIHSFNKYEVKNRGEVPIIKIKNDCALLNPNSFLYAQIDDDFEFRNYAYIDYLRSIHFMLKYNNCGIMNFVHSYKGYIKPNQIGIAKSINERVMTGRGLIFKRCKLFQFTSDDSLKLVGSGEELILTAIRLHLGYFMGILPTGRCINSINKSKGYVKYGWTNNKILKNNQHKFLSELSGIPIEEIIEKTYMFIKPEDYYHIGGINPEENRYEYLIDYSNIEESDLIKSIYNLIDMNEVMN